MDLPLPFRPVIATRSPGARSRSTGPSRKLPRSATAASSETTRVARPPRGREREVQLPGLVRLVDVLHSLERTLRLSHLARERVRAAPVGAAGRLREEAAARASLVAAGVQQRLQLAAPLLGLRELGVLLSPRPVPGCGEVAPAAGELAHTARPRVELGDSRHRPVEEGAVVRDDGDSALEAVHEALEPVEAVEVEVVRRLVEEEQVVAGEEDRCQRRASGLAPRQCRRLLLERDGKAELGADGPRPRLEVASAQREEALERRRVGIRAPIAGVSLDVCLRRRDAGAPGQVREQCLAGTPLVLLRQIADRERRGRPLDATLVRLVEAGGEPQQRRLAGTVRADEAEPGTRAERQIDAVEHGVGAEGADDAVERDAQGTSQRP